MPTGSVAAVGFIGGFPRAGTRQFADIMNQHESVEIKGELYPNSFELAGKMLLQADKDHGTRWSAAQYHSNRLASALNIVAAISKGSNRPFSRTTTVAGFKCPRIERQKSIVDALFAQAVSRPIQFFFCVRDLVEDYLSVNSNFNTPAEVFIQDTIGSIESFLRLLDDERYDVHVLNLDGFVGSHNKGQWLKINLFDPLPGVTVSADEAFAFFAATTNRNSTSAVGRRRKSKIDPEAAALINDHDQLWRAAARFQDQTHIRLLAEWIGPGAL